MLRVRIVHWKPEEAVAVVKACEAAGFAPEYDAGDFPVVSRAIRQNLPDALVIDLSRMPSHGREVAFAIRKTKYTRHLPLVFVDGEPEKVAALRAQLPDAEYCSLKRLGAAVKAACKKRVENPVSPPTVMERYGGRTTAEKLGVKAGSSVALFGAPRNYGAVLGAMPEGVVLVEEPVETHAVTLWFVNAPLDYQDGLREMSGLAGKTKFWVVWRKGAKHGLGDKLIREAGLENGLVDYKICLVNAEWSGMLFARKKA